MLFSEHLLLCLLFGVVVLANNYTCGSKLHKLPYR